MFYFMSKGDFYRVSAIVEVINGKSYLLPNEDAQKILKWVNDCNHEQFDNFCLEVAEEWHDSYPWVTAGDHEEIAKIIHNLLSDADITTEPNPELMAVWTDYAKKRGVR